MNNMTHVMKTIGRSGSLHQSYIARNLSGTQRSMANVGFIGVGNMGGHMARNLIKAGHNVTVYDVVEDNLKALKADGAKTVSNPAGVAPGNQIIVTMLPSSPNVTECYTGNNGLLSAVEAGTLLIDSSTIDPQVSKHVADVAMEKKAFYLDAPVSGGVNAARDAGLTFMVGGPSDKFEQAKQLLSQMGKNVVHCGDVGTGQAAKICNNMMLGISMIGVSETMNLGKRLGLEPALLASIMNTSSGRCWASDTYNPCPGVLPGVPASNNYQGGFGTALMTKDLGLAQDAATATKSPNPLGSLAHQLYRIMCNQGYSELDFSSAYKFLQEQENKKN